MMSTNPVHYRGVTRDDIDEGGGASERRSPTSFNISAGPDMNDSRENQKPLLSTVTLIYLISTVIFTILAIFGVVYLADINSVAQDYISTKTVPSGYSTSHLKSLGSKGDSKITGIALYHDPSGSLVLQVPLQLLSSQSEFLLVEQLTTGTGNRDLYWDAGSVILQDVVLFRQTGANQVDLVTRQQAYRGATGLMHRSFPDAVLWSFDIVHTTDSALLINADDFLLSGIGNLHGEDIPTVLRGVYGAQYTYTVNRHRSAINFTACTANDYRAVMERTITYTSTNSAIPPLANVGKQFSLTSRRTLLHLEQYAKLQSKHSGQSDYTPYKPRPYHPMSGLNSISYMNEDAGLLDMRQQLSVVRHRLYPSIKPSATAAQNAGETAEERNPPTANDVAGMLTAVAKAQRPVALLDSTAKSHASTDIPAHAQLVYYIDSDTPPGIREALVDGVNWWDAAFQAAGYPQGTFFATTADRSKFDPYDLQVPKRNFVEWVDRDLRAYSLGIRIADPGTGEILKGHVRIENLRMRQDALIAEALLGPFGSPSPAAHVTETGEDSLDVDHGESALQAALKREIAGLSQTSAGSAEATAAVNVAMLSGGSKSADEVAAVILQRVRQLGAHEVGHTLGLAHNFAGSSAVSGYASVMDYPPPIVTVDSTGTKLVLNAASYATGIGAFDKVSIAYAYKQLGSVTDAQERAALNKLLQNAVQRDGYVFLTDQDSAVAAGDWRGSQWDSGNSPIAALNTSLTVRALALRRLEAAEVLPMGAPYSRLQELFPIIYLWHRYLLRCYEYLIPYVVSVSARRSIYVL
jgi:hypothetical protein